MVMPITVTTSRAREWKMMDVVEKDSFLHSISLWKQFIFQFSSGKIPIVEFTESYHRFAEFTCFRTY